MKTGRLVLGVIVFFMISFSSTAQEVEWMSFEEAVARSEEEPRKILIDIYTDWCGWCKKMDKEAYSNEKLASYINENFYPVKFDAEQRESIEFRGHTFKFVSRGKSGVHELAAALTQNQLSYPTTVFMNEELQILQPIPGYMDAKSLDPIVRYFGGDYFKNTQWADFQKTYQSSL